MDTNWGHFSAVLVQCEQQIILVKIVVLKFLFYFLESMIEISKKTRDFCIWSVRMTMNSCCFSTSDLINIHLAASRSILKLPYWWLNSGPLSYGRPYSNQISPQLLFLNCIIRGPCCRTSFSLKPFNTGSDMFYSFQAVTLLHIYLGTSE